MRWFSLLALNAVLGAAAFGADVQIVRVWPQWNDEATFDRVGEYFGGSENHGREVAVRTQPTQRAGMYFLVRWKSAAPVTDGRFVLELIRPDSPEPRQYTFPVSLPAKSGVIDLGLTGPDWPGGRTVHPVAWRLTLLDASGQPLATEQSFLWSKSAK